MQWHTEGLWGGSGGSYPEWANARVEDRNSEEHIKKIARLTKEKKMFRKLIEHLKQVGERAWKD